MNSILQFFLLHPSKWHRPNNGGPLQTYAQWRMSLIPPWSRTGSICIAVHIANAGDIRRAKISGWIKGLK